MPESIDPSLHRKQTKLSKRPELDGQATSCLLPWTWNERVLWLGEKGMMFGYSGIWGVLYPGIHLGDWLVRVKVCQIVWFGEERGSGWLPGEFGAKQIKTPTLARSSLPSEGLEQSDTTTLKIQLGLMRLLRLFPNNKGTRRGGSPKLHQDRNMAPVSRRQELVVLWWLPKAPCQREWWVGHGCPPPRHSQEVGWKVIWTCCPHAVRDMGTVSGSVSLLMTLWA